jgi:GT2 family glycosyltransferase
MEEINKIAVLLTCHNRKDKTLTCLEALLKNTIPIGYSLEVFLLDDGSTDGTSQAVHDSYSQVNIIKGDGNLFWNRGMRVAFSAAMKKGFDYYLWLNDDTLLYPTAIQSLLETSVNLKIKYAQSVIVVGATEDEKGGRLTYGGVVRASRWKRTAFTLIKPSEVPVECETMNGNCVLIPDEVAQAVGGMEPEFAHAMGDLDYGLRARETGFFVWVMPGYAGTCANNPTSGSFNDPSLSVILRLRKMLQPKGLPLRSWRIFTQRHAGIFWPIFWLWPYVKILIMGLARK